MATTSTARDGTDSLCSFCNSCLQNPGIMINRTIMVNRVCIVNKNCRTLSHREISNYPAPNLPLAYPKLSQGWAWSSRPAATNSRIENSAESGPRLEYSQARQWSSRVRYARSVFSVPTVDRASNKTAHSAAMTESDAEKNNASTYHDASICSLKRGRKLVSFFLCRMPPILLPRFCRSASSSSTVRWARLCSASV